MENVLQAGAKRMLPDERVLLANFDKNKWRLNLHVSKKTHKIKLSAEIMHQNYNQNKWFKYSKYKNELPRLERS